jgi:hypothetical protein
MHDFIQSEFFFSLGIESKSKLANKQKLEASKEEINNLKNV